MLNRSGFRCVLLTAMVVGCCALWTPMSAEAEVIKVGSDQYVSLQGHVYADLNHNRTLDEDEWVIPNVVIQCTLAEPVPTGGTPVTESATTDQYGFFSFSGLQPGTYILSEDDPIAFMQGLPGNPGTVNGSPVGQADGPDKFVNITLAAGDAGKDYNFGESGLRSAYLSKRYLLTKQEEIEEIPEPSGVVLLTIGSLLCLGLTGMGRARTRG